MRVLKLSTIFIFIIILIATQSQTTITIVSQSVLSQQLIDSDGSISQQSWFIANCQQYEKNVTIDGNSIQTNYKCHKCYQNTGVTILYDLFLITKSDGTQACIRKSFYSQGCSQYDLANYESLIDKTGFQSQAGAYFYAFNCISCSTQSNRIVKADVDYYYETQIFYDLLIDLATGQQMLTQNELVYGFFLTSLKDIQFCQPFPNLQNGCIHYRGNQSLGNSQQPNQFYQDLLNRTTKYCTQCVQGFTLGSNCTLCDQENGWVRSKQNAWTCFTSTPNCKQYSQTQDVCTSCNIGWKFFNDRCDACDTGNGYILQSNNCVPTATIQIVDFNTLNQALDFTLQQQQFFIAECSKYQVTTQSDDLGTTITYKCLECNQIARDGYYELFLLRQSDGIQRCIKKSFYSQGCTQYDPDTSLSVFTYVDDSTGLPIQNLQRYYEGSYQPFTCTTCPLDSNRIITQDAYKYFDIFVPQLFNIDFLESIPQDAFGFFIHPITNLHFCQPFNKLENGCIHYKANQTYLLLDQLQTFSQDLLNQTAKICLQCADGFLLESGCLICDQKNGLIMSKQLPWTCIIPTPNCLQYSLTTDDCTHCQIGRAVVDGKCDTCDTQNGYILQSDNCVCDSANYIPSVSGTGCILKVQNCGNYLNDLCSSCINNFDLHENQCINCKSGYRRSLVTVNLCTLSVINCLEYDNVDACKTCATGFKLADNLCQECDTGNGYRRSDVDSSVCILAVPHCDLYNSDKCVQCQTPYALLNFECNYCASGYRNSDVDPTVCILAALNCAHYALDICDVCDVGYLFSSGNCNSCAAGYRGSSANPGTCILAVPHCHAYDSADSCTQCEVKYLLQSENCNTCASGFRNSDVNLGACVAEIQHCSSYNADVCDTCKNGYASPQTNCDSCASGFRTSDVQPAKCILQISKCAIYSNDLCTLCKNTQPPVDGSCDSCGAGFRSSDNDPDVCVAVIAHCDAYTLDLCSTCKTGYQIQSGQCQNCADGYRKSDLDASICILASPHCNAYLQDVCKGCSAGYLLQSAKCENCSLGYRKSDLIPGNCVLGINRCIIYSQDLCTKCSTGYASQNCNNCDDGYRKSDLNQNICILSVNNCNSYLQNVCKGCVAGYSLKNGRCDTCATGYRPSDIYLGTCVQQINNCRTYMQDLCTKCVTGFAVLDGKCETCASGYRKSNLDPNTCIPVINRCVNYQQDYCIGCSTGYLLQNKKCQNCAPGYRKSDANPGICLLTVSNCNNYRNDQCISCANGYLAQNGRCDNCAADYRKSDLTPGICILTVKNCGFYIQDKCNACTTGYLLQNFKCDKCVSGYRKSDLNSAVCLQEISGCATYSRDTCTNCQAGKRFSDFNDQLCISAVPYCSVYINDVCQECVGGYDFPDDNDKTQCVLMTTIRHCKELIPQAKYKVLRCKTCDDGYHLKQDYTLCYQNIPYCSINVDILCSLCVYGYYASADKKACLVNPVCPDDTALINWEALNGVCVAIDGNCQFYTSTGDCTKCKTHYKLVNGQCKLKSIQDQDSSSFERDSN